MTDLPQTIHHDRSFADRYHIFWTVNALYFAQNTVISGRQFHGCGASSFSLL